MTSLNLKWYWSRFRAMAPDEAVRHVFRKVHQRVDHLRPPDWPSAAIGTGGAFPQLPDPRLAPPGLRDAVRHDAEEILAGRWAAFGHLPLVVGDPPRWHMDYLVGVDLETDRPAFGVSHRKQPHGADIKLVWEPSRWNQLVRLAQAAYLLQDAAAYATTVRWLRDWARHNPPHLGLNWTSGLETGLRLIQFAWIDALLAGSQGAGDLGSLRAEVVAPHTWYTWRYRSFGSSANNHLLGELAGLIVALVRWPSAARFAVPLERLHELWQEQVLLQFAPDGGNLEQALAYHLFSWELCWQARVALLRAGRGVKPEVDEQLRRSAAFYSALKVDEWDFGDSDNAYVTPAFARENTAPAEWRAWFIDPKTSPALDFWWSAQGEALGSSPDTPGAGAWRTFEDSGYAIYRGPEWLIRFDCSPLGFLSTAAHGHQDALHVSLWHRGAAILIDPGTGAYYADPAVRTHLASWDAHNGPHPCGDDWPRRRGTFLWETHHARPEMQLTTGDALVGRLTVPRGCLVRTVRPVPHGWQIQDSFRSRSPDRFQVRWVFAPGTHLQRVDDRTLLIARLDASLTMHVGPGCSPVGCYQPPGNAPDVRSHRLLDLGEVPLQAVSSPAFRALTLSPFVLLQSDADHPDGLQTTFVASS